MSRIAMAALLLGALAWADAPKADAPAQHGTAVTLSADASREVPNDEAQVVLYAEFDDANAAALSDKLNRALADALAQAKAYATVKAAVAGNNVYPTYDRNNKITGWRGRADLRLDSDDFKSLAELTGKLQARLQIGNMNFGLSRAHRDKVETELIDDAIKALNVRAEAVRKSLGGKGYRITNLQVNPGDTNIRVPRMMVAAAPMAKASSVAAPPMEAGQAQVSINISGTIEVE